MGAGRFVCVALPFALTIASIICILIAMLAGITSKELNMFEVNMKNLSISTNALQNVVNGVSKRDLGDLTNAALNSGSQALNNAADGAVNSALSGNNLTAKDLGLADVYQVFLWNYCAESAGSDRNCTDGKFDWASSSLNTTAIDETSAAASSVGVDVKLPKDIRAALKTFVVVSKWTQVVYIIAIIAAAVELIFGLFAICSRMGSCCTFIISGISTVTIIIASIMATVMSSVVTGAVLTVSKAYGVKASLNTGFLSVTWLAVAFSLGAGLFWGFSICCCKNESRSSKRKSHSDSEKLIPAGGSGSYQRVSDPYAGQQHGIYNNQEYGVPMHNVKPTPARGNGAYEPSATLLSK